LLPRVPMRLQVGLFLLIFSGSIALWASRDSVSQAWASLNNTNAASEKSKRRGRAKGRPLPVLVARVGEAEDTINVAAVGTARAGRAIMLTAKVDGVLVSLTARAGARVRKGDPLFSVDDRKAILAEKLATKRLADARRLLDRSAYLKRRRVNSSAFVEDASSAVAKAEVELAQAKELMRDVRVVAPFDGVVGIAKFEVGDRVTAGNPVLALDDRRRLVIEFDLPEQVLARISIGQAVAATTPSHGARKFAGVIDSIDSRVDPVSRSVKARATIRNPNDALRPGMSFLITVTLPGARYPSVPQLALQWQGRDSYVWVVDQGSVRRQPVKAVRRQDDNVLVSGALDLGALIVVEGVQRLRPGRRVAFDAPAPTAPDEAAEPAAASAAALKETGTEQGLGR